jgi:hypothetical protein
MVDSGGTLYYIVHTFNNSFAWCRFTVRKITPSGTQSIYGFTLNASCIGAYACDWYTNKVGSETSQYGNIAWVTMMPCIAQEVNGTSEYIHAITYIPPSRWWNTSSGPDTEGLMVMRIKKSDLSIATTKFIAAYKGDENYVGRSLRADGFGNFANLIYNRNCFSAIYNVGEKKTLCFLVT